MYLATACAGFDQSIFPPDNLFAAAGEGIWDNGASCGRLYQVRCINAERRRACSDPRKIILVRIVDRAQTSVSRPVRNGAAVVLSVDAFNAIANPQQDLINVEFIQRVSYY